jgi:hypothetical protein
MVLVYGEDLSLPFFVRVAWTSESHRLGLVELIDFSHLLLTEREVIERTVLLQSLLLLRLRNHSPPLLHRDDLFLLGHVA